MHDRIFRKQITYIFSSDELSLDHIQYCDNSVTRTIDGSTYIVLIEKCTMNTIFILFKLVPINLFYL